MTLRRAFIVLLVLLTLAFAFAVISNRAKEERPAPAPVRENPFERLSLDARAVFVADLAHAEILFAKNEEAQLPLASLTKLMTALVAAQRLPKDSTIVIEKSDLLPEGDTHLSAGQRWPLAELLRFSLMTSSNDAVAAVARTLGERETVRAVNAQAKALGLAQTFFENASGLDIGPSFSGGYGSARDTAALFSYLLRAHPELLAKTAVAEALFAPSFGKPIVGKNTNSALSAIPGMIGGKTGYTDLAGGNLAFAFDAGVARPIVVVILGSSFEGRFTDAVALAQTALAAIQKTNNDHGI